jgi:hypothetical protein
MAQALLARNSRSTLAYALLCVLMLSCQRRSMSTSSILVPLGGTWTATGYLCDGPAPPELVRITHKGTHVHAVKLKGDMCVGDDQPTFEGYYTRNTFPIKLFNALGFTAGTMRVISADKLELREDGPQVITYVRQTSPPARPVAKP